MAVALHVHCKDQVATVFSEKVHTGDVIIVHEPDGKQNVLTSLSDIPYGHKIAVRSISMGEEIFKYGESIGAATQNIAEGEHVHIHNLISLRARGDLCKGETD